MIIRYTAYTTSPRADAERSRKYRERDPEGWSLGGWGGPVSHMPDKSRTVLLEVPDEMGWQEVEVYCEGIAATLNWPITEGRVEENVELPKVLPWDPGVHVDAMRASELRQELDGLQSDLLFQLKNSTV
jgi:hypothetical protein